MLNLPENSNNYQSPHEIRINESLTGGLEGSGLMKGCFFRKKRKRGFLVLLWANISFSSELIQNEHNSKKN